MQESDAPTTPSPAPGRLPRSPRVWLAAAAAAVLAALLVRLVGLGGEPLWVDEAYALHVAGRSSFAAVLADHDNTPPLYLLVLHAWIQVAGTSPFALRLPSALFGTAAVALAFPVARRFTTPAGAALATALAALSVYAIVEGQDARAYALFLLTAAWSFLALLRLREEWTRPRAAAYVAATALMLYSHAYGLFFLAAQNLDALWPPRPLPLRRWFVVQAGVALLFLPWLGVLLTQAASVASGFWLTKPGPVALKWTAVTLAGSRWLAYACGAVLAFGCLLAWRRRGGARTETPGPRLPWLWLVAPAVLSFLVAQAVPIYLPKYLLPASLALAVLVARSALRLPRPAVPVAVALLLALSVAAAVAYQSGGRQEDSRQDWSGAAALVDAQAAPGAVLLFNDGYCDSATDADLQCPWDLVSNRSDLVQVPFLPRSVPVDAGNVGQVDARVAGAPQAWVLYGYVTDPNHLIPARLAQLGFHAAGSWELKHLDVLRFDRGPA